MPYYVYEVVLEDDEPGQLFEIWQKMSDEPLTEHPQTGQPVRRVIQPPNIGGRNSAAKEKNRLSDSNLEKHGFTKYVKSGDGEYDKTAGKGPGKIQKK